MTTWKILSRAVDGVFDRTRFNTNSTQHFANNVRTLPTRFSNLRNDGANNVDASILKNFDITASVRLQFRCEFFNHMTFNGPKLDPTNSNFGLPRSTQMALRLTW